MGDHQADFIEGKSTIDHIFCCRQIYFFIDSHHLFIDFQQVFDSVDRNKLWTETFELGIPNKLIELVKMTRKEA